MSLLGGLYLHSLLACTALDHQYLCVCAEKRAMEGELVALQGQLTLDCYIAAYGDPDPILVRAAIELLHDQAKVAL